MTTPILSRVADPVTTNPNDLAFALGRMDALEGHYRPTEYFHFNDEVRLMHYDAGHASVTTRAWRWTPDYCDEQPGVAEFQPSLGLW